MSTQLSEEEKQSVIDIMETIFGYDSAFRNQKAQINDRTVVTLEETLIALRECNEDIKGLLAESVGAAAMSGKGWLRWSLKAVGRVLENRKLKLNGAACRGMVSSSRKSYIYSTLW